MVCGLAFEGKQKDWLKSMPELDIIAEVEPVFVFNQNSVDISTDIWTKLAQEIYSRMDEAAGFVVLHGLDNLLYTSAALSFMLQNLTKPIIFTGGLFDQTKNKKIDIRANLINAAQAASLDFTEVGLMFGNRLLRANQSSIAADETLNLFVAPDTAILGRIDFSIRIFDKLVAKNTGKTTLFDKLNANIEVVKISPLINLKDLTQRLTDKQGVIIKAGKFQSIPADIMFILEKVTADLPIVIWSKVIQPSAVSPKNLIIINNITWESTLTKFIWALGQSREIKTVKQLMSDEVAQEILD